MPEWLKRRKHGGTPDSIPQEAAQQTEIGNPPKPAETAASDPLTELLKMEYSEAERMISKTGHGLDPDYLYIADDGHLEFSYYDCDMTPPSMFEKVFDLTFPPVEADKLCRALGLEEDIIARGGADRFVCVFRALMRCVTPRYGSLALSEDFPALLRRHGIRTAHGSEARRLWKDSPFNFERQELTE